MRVRTKVVLIAAALAVVAAIVVVGTSGGGTVSKAEGPAPAAADPAAAGSRRLPALPQAQAAAPAVAAATHVDPRPASPQCEACEKRQCNPAMAGCEALAGAERANCAAALSCIRSSHCAASGAPEPCLCGTVSLEECLLGRGNGPCRAELDRASQTTASDIAGRFEQIAERYFNPRFPLGRAVNLIECDQRACATECAL